MPAGDTRMSSTVTLDGRHTVFGSRGSKPSFLNHWEPEIGGRDGSDHEADRYVRENAPRAAVGRDRGRACRSRRAWQTPSCCSRAGHCSPEQLSSTQTAGCAEPRAMGRRGAETERRTGSASGVSSWSFSARRACAECVRVVAWQIPSRPAAYLPSSSVYSSTPSSVAAAMQTL